MRGEIYTTTPKHSLPMALVNENYLKLQSSYLFSEVARRVREYEAEKPPRKIIRLGIGDVTEPLPRACVDAMADAVREMGCRDTFRGYGPEQGYAFLREAIAENDFRARGCDIAADEIFVSDGAKCDTGNFQELFSAEARIAVPDPVYPVYVDTNVMAGRTGDAADGRYAGLLYLEGNAANGFIPAPPAGERPDIVYLCFPNNPTGATATREQLAAWVKWARESGTIILFDAAYEAFIRDPAVPHSIYEIDGARDVAVEFRSFSKTAGFTGTRCAFTVVPKSVIARTRDGAAVALHGLWNRRQTTKFNGVSYPVQRAAAAVYTKAGREQTRALIDGYLANAKAIRAKLTSLGYECTGGDNSPYVWMKAGEPSWDAFDTLLREKQIVTTPGAGFGRCGEGYIRFSAFNSPETVAEAMARL